MANKPDRSRNISDSIINIAGLLFIILLLGFLIMVSAQETFKDILIPLGLYHSRTGALIECSQPGSEKSRYCNPEREDRYKRINKSNSGAGFNLFD